MFLPVVPSTPGGLRLSLTALSGGPEAKSQPDQTNRSNQEIDSLLSLASKQSLLFRLEETRISGSMSGYPGDLSYNQALALDQVSQQDYTFINNDLGSSW